MMARGAAVLLVAAQFLPHAVFVESEKRNRQQEPRRDKAYDAGTLAARPPVLGRIHEGRFLLDLRGVFDPAELVVEIGA